MVLRFLFYPDLLSVKGWQRKLNLLFWFELCRFVCRNLFLNNIVEQDHRFIKWRIQQGLGFKEFESARRTLAGIEIVRMIKKNQMVSQDETTFRSFTSLAA
ncbi:MAG: hypothetical protein CBB76_08540 [Crocinitomicaceae bacterium TMED16]|nr:MAG: hypothetical protein CBB76_08540 [Crocinitomicaceae bacterium TMED16]